MLDDAAIFQLGAHTMWLNVKGSRREEKKLTLFEKLFRTAVLRLLFNVLGCKFPLYGMPASPFADNLVNFGMGNI